MTSGGLPMCLENSGLQGVCWNVRSESSVVGYEGRVEGIGISFMPLRCKWSPWACWDFAISKSKGQKHF